MNQKWTAAGCILWIVGLAGFIIGLNLEGNARGWLETGGTILFLIGLGITGVIWLRQKKG